MPVDNKIGIYKIVDVIRLAGLSNTTYNSINFKIIL